MGLTKADVAAIAKNADSSMSTKIVKTLAHHGTKPAAVAHALALTPMSAPQRRKLLYALVKSSPEGAARLSLLANVDARLRVELPTRLANTPLTLVNFGVSTTDEMADLITARLTRMETGAASLAEFQAGLDGWRRNIVGSVLFERLIKYDPHLSLFINKYGTDFIRIINNDIADKPRALLGVDGKARTVSELFGPPRKVVKVALVGPDDVTREFTDFGQLAVNPQDWWAFLPIELKLERALAGVAGQFSEFRPRLSVAKSMIATVIEGGEEVQHIIKPAQLVFLRHDLGQTVIAPTSAKQIAAIRASGPIDPSSIASIVDFGPAFSHKHQSMYYRARVLVDRRWLEELIMPLTDP
ncbi:hypothetical protein Pmi06nite_64630 [Planotetraspora mira]|uniref:Uncharacterized protein n=2 Tax=Planotetraspora mira TaxID=58121 RepID=A0A8J3XA55_9ACTN|nr:hypothetical protein Pmi06nite_64630 [Planotetraspora mira]